VDKVYQEMVNQTEIEDLSDGGSSQEKSTKENPEDDSNTFQRGVKTLADIFIPILPAIVTAGLLLGLSNLLTTEGIFMEEAIVQAYPAWAGIANMVALIANTAFTFLSALVGWSAAPKFGGSSLLGVVLGLVLVNPTLISPSSVATAQDIPTWNLFGLEIQQIGYQGQVLPMLVASYFLAKIEIGMKKITPDSIQMLFVGPVALLVAGIASFIVIGPITLQLSQWITDGIIAIINFSPILGGLIYGGFYEPLVITGMHHLFLAVDLQLVGSTGGTFLWPMLALSNIAQGSAALAILFVSNKENTKGLALTSSISAYLGVTEPAMFGVNLNYRYGFISAMIGSALAGGWVLSQNVMASSIGIGGLPAFLSIFPENWGSFFIGMGIVLVIPFVLTLIIGKTKEAKS